MTGHSDPLPAPCHVLACLVGKATKERQDGCLFPITLPVTDGLGEHAAGALNALVPVPTSGGGRHPYPRGLSIRTCQFPYSRVVGSRASDDSHDTPSVFEATVVEDRVYDWGGVESEASTFVRMLSLCASVRLPLTDIPDSSPRVSIRALALEWRLFFVVEFSWGRASDPAGVAPEPLEEFLTPSRVILPNLRKRSRCPSWKAS